MRTGVIVEKIGMSRMYQDNGESFPITILKMNNCRIVDHKTEEKNGYNALVMGYGESKEKHVSKPMLGFYKHSKITPAKKLKEFRISEDAFVEVGKEILPSHFVKDQFVDVTGMTIGKGFAGVIKRHNFRSLRATHGVSLTHRSHGSTGQRQDPGRVFKGKKMAGRLGNEQVTTQNLRVLSIDDSKGLIIVKGNIPGYEGSFLTVKDSVKKKTPEGVPFPAAIK